MNKNYMDCFAISGTNASFNSEWSALLNISSDDLENFFNLNPDLTTIISGQGNFLYVNSLWKNKLGYSTKEIIGRPFLDLIHPDDVDKTKLETQACFTRKTPKTFTNRYLKKNGKPIWLQWRSSYDPERNLFYCVVRDISDLIDLNETQGQLEHAQFQTAVLTTTKLISQEVISELNSPLFNIGAHTELIQAKVEGKAEYDELISSHLSEIQTSISKLNQIIKGFNRLTCSSPIGSETVSLKEIIEDISLLVNRKLSLSNIKLNSSSINPNILIKCNRVELSQSIYQILDLIILRYNLVQLVGSKDITLTVEKSISHICLSISFKYNEEMQNDFVDEKEQVQIAVINKILEKDNTRVSQKLALEAKSYEILLPSS